MLERGKMERGVVEFVDTESLVPEGHLLREMDRAVDFGKLYEIVEPLYSEDEGRPSIDPVVLFKIVRAAAAPGWDSVAAGNPAQSADGCGVPVVLGVYAERGASTFFHSEL